MDLLNHQIDNTLIKIILNSVQDRDLSVIKQNVQKFNLNMNLLIEKDFFMALVKNNSDALNICKYLVELRVNTAHKDKYNQTCLYYALREGKYESSKYLIEECNLPLNEKDIYGQNPIY